MRFILRRIVYGIAGFLGMLTYLSLRPYPFAIDVALCVGFTVEVIGLVTTARLFGATPSKPLPPVKTMLLMHAGFLAGVVVIERIFPLLQVLFPGGPETRSGRPGSWAMLIEVIAIAVLGYGERVLLLRGPKAVKAGVWAETAIGAAVVPAGQIASAPPGQPFGMAATVGTLAPELGSHASSPGYTSVTGLYSSSMPSAAPVVAASETVAAAVAAPDPAEISANARGYASITGLVAAGPEAGGSSMGGAPRIASTGDDYEGFIQHMKQGKRPFRKPGMTVKDEFHAWLADRARTANGVPEKKQSGFSRFLMGDNRAKSLST